MMTSLDRIGSFADPWTIQRRASVVVVGIHEERLFDPIMIDRLDKAVRAELTSEDDVVIDLSRVRFISSAMLGRMVMLWMASQQHGRRVVLCGLNSTLTQIMRIAGLQERVETYPDRVTAVLALKERSP
jgi:anti-anti-sigma factor